MGLWFNSASNFVFSTTSMVGETAWLFITVFWGNKPAAWLTCLSSETVSTALIGEIKSLHADCIDSWLSELSSHEAGIGISRPTFAASKGK